MKLDPLKIKMTASVKGLGANKALARAVGVGDDVISRLYKGGEVAMKLAPRFAAALGVREIEIVSDDADFAVNLATLQAWRKAGSPSQPLLSGGALLAAVSQ